LADVEEAILREEGFIGGQGAEEIVSGNVGSGVDGDNSRDAYGR
jgi:hypothetical protein